MLIEKRRPYSSFAVILIIGIVGLSVWRFTGCPGPPVCPTLAPPVFTPLVAFNASSSPYEIEQLPPWDYTTLINLDDFTFDLINFPCNETTNDPPLLLVLIHSASTNQKKREIIRETWGQTRESLRVLFILGQSNQTVQDAIRDENSKHRDIIQGNFFDTYRNMTYKHVMAMKYTIYHCPQAKYILKSDDDIFVNMPVLMNFLHNLSPYGARRLLMCTPLSESQVKRSFRSKWRVSPKEYAERVYPTYCPGWAVLYSPDVVFILYREAQKSEYFWIDDVHITGTLAKRVNLKHTSTYPLALTREQVDQILSSDGNSSDLSFLYGAPNLKQDKIIGLWKIVQKKVKSIS